MFGGAVVVLELGLDIIANIADFLWWTDLLPLAKDYKIPAWVIMLSIKFYDVWKCRVSYISKYFNISMKSVDWKFWKPWAVTVWIFLLRILFSEIWNNLDRIHHTQVIIQLEVIWGSDLNET